MDYIHLYSNCATQGDSGSLNDRIEDQYMGENCFRDGWMAVRIK